MDVLRTYWPDLLRGFWVTLRLSLLSWGVGLMIGMILATCRVSPIRPLRIAAGAYTAFMINIPIAVWMVVFFFGFTKIGILYGLETSAAIVGATWVGAYLGEAIRAGINAVPNGQAEAARAIGLPFRHVLGSVVLPQALRSAIGPSGVVLNATYRNIAAAGTIGVAEAVNRWNFVIDSESQPPLWPTLFAFGGFFVLGIVTSVVFSQLQRHFAVAR